MNVSLFERLLTPPSALPSAPPEPSLSHATSLDVRSAIRQGASYKLTASEALLDEAVAHSAAIMAVLQDGVGEAGSGLATKVMLLKTPQGLILLSACDGAPTGPARLPLEGSFKYGLVTNGKIVTTYDKIEWRVKAGIAWASPGVEGQSPMNRMICLHHTLPYLHTLTRPLPH